MYNVPGLIKTQWGLIFSSESPPFLIFQTLRCVIISSICWPLQVNCRNCTPKTYQKLKKNSLSIRKSLKCGLIDNKYRDRASIAKKVASGQ